MVHCVVECVWERVKLHRRMTPALPAVSYVRADDDKVRDYCTITYHSGTSDKGHFLMNKINIFAYNFSKWTK